MFSEKGEKQRTEGKQLQIVPKNSETIWDDPDSEMACFAACAVAWTQGGVRLFHDVDFFGGHNPIQHIQHKHTQKNKRTISKSIQVNRMNSNLLVCSTTV